MKFYPDTSFLYGLYIPQKASEQAISYYDQMTETLQVSGLVLFEFRQSVRFQVYRNAKDKTQGYSRHTAEEDLSRLQSNIASGALVVIPADWADVHHIAERLSLRYTKIEGYQSFDILHVATALHLGAQEFLTFDVSQKRLAQSEGLKVPW